MPEKKYEMSIKREKQFSAELLDRFNRRDTSAFAAVYTWLFVELHAFAIRLFGNFDSIDPKDIVQDAFVYLWEERKVTFDESYKIRVYLMVVIKNRYMHEFSHCEVKDKYRKFVEYENESIDEVAYYDQYSALCDHVEQLKDPTRQVIRYYLAGYGADDISRRMCMSVQTIYNLKSQAIKCLKKLMMGTKVD